MLDLSTVYKVYTGKANRCCCGCSGKYKIASQHRAFADQDRGYEHDDSDVNDVAVRRVVGRILASANPEDEGGHVYAVVGKTMYVAYYNKDLTAA